MFRWSVFFLIVPVVGVALFAAAEHWGWSLPPVASTLGARVDHLYYVMLALTGAVFIFTQLALAFVIFFYTPSKSADTASRQGEFLSALGWFVLPILGFIALVWYFPMPQEARWWFGASLCIGWPAILLLLLAGKAARTRATAVYSHGNKNLEIVWTLVPTVILIGVLIYQFPVWRDYRFPRPIPDDVLPIRVIGRQFEWRIVYPGRDGKLDTADDVHAVNELHVAKGQDVWIDLRAMDVIHSLFLPYHRIKQDAVPGLSIPVWFDCPLSTWEFQASQASISPDDIPDLEALINAIEEAGTPARAHVKEKLGGSISGENGTIDAAALASLLNQFLEDDGFYAPERFEADSLSEEVKALVAFGPTGELTRLLNRKLLSAAFPGLIAPLVADFDIMCTELCGWGHYKMKGRLIVHQTPELLEAWLESRTAWQEATQ